MKIDSFNLDIPTSSAYFWQRIHLTHLIHSTHSIWWVAIYSRQNPYDRVWDRKRVVQLLCQNPAYEQGHLASGYCIVLMSPVWVNRFDSSHSSCMNRKSLRMNRKGDSTNSSGFAESLTTHLEEPSEPCDLWASQQGPSWITQMTRVAGYSSSCGRYPTRVLMILQSRLSPIPGLPRI